MSGAAAVDHLLTYYQHRTERQRLQSLSSPRTPCRDSGPPFDTPMGSNPTRFQKAAKDPALLLLLDLSSMGAQILERPVVVYAHDCEPCELCGEPICWHCGEHYAHCPCPGPDTEDETAS